MTVHFVSGASRDCRIPISPETFEPALRELCDRERKASPSEACTGHGGSINPPPVEQLADRSPDFLAGTELLALCDLGLHGPRPNA